MNPVIHLANLHASEISTWVNMHPDVRISGHDAGEALFGACNLRYTLGFGQGVGLTNMTVCDVAPKQSIIALFSKKVMSCLKSRWSV